MNGRDRQTLMEYWRYCDDCKKIERTLCQRGDKGPATIICIGCKATDNGMTLQGARGERPDKKKEAKLINNSEPALEVRRAAPTFHGRLARVLAKDGGVQSYVKLAKK